MVKFLKVSENPSPKKTKSEKNEKNDISDWNKNYRPRKSESWIFLSGPSNISRDSTPLSIFKKLWSESLTKGIIERTNKIEKNEILNEKKFSFYLASILIMGVVPQGQIQHYWNRDPDGVFGNKFIQNLGKFGFVRETFQKINSHLHIDSKLIVDTLNTSFKQYYKPGQHLSIDECLTLFKGIKN